MQRLHIYEDSINCIPLQEAEWGAEVTDLRGVNKLYTSTGGGVGGRGSISAGRRRRM